MNRSGADISLSTCRSPEITKRAIVRSKGIDRYLTIAYQAGNFLFPSPYLDCLWHLPPRGIMCLPCCLPCMEEDDSHPREANSSRPRRASSQFFTSEKLVQRQRSRFQHDVTATGRSPRQSNMTERRGDRRSGATESVLPEARPRYSQKQTATAKGPPPANPAANRRELEQTSNPERSSSRKVKSRRSPEATYGIDVAGGSSAFQTITRSGTTGQASSDGSPTRRTKSGNSPTATYRADITESSFVVQTKTGGGTSRKASPAEGSSLRQAKSEHSPAAAHKVDAAEISSLPRAITKSGASNGDSVAGFPPQQPISMHSSNSILRVDTTGRSLPQTINKSEPSGHGLLEKVNSLKQAELASSNQAADGTADADDLSPRKTPTSHQATRQPAASPEELSRPQDKTEPAAIMENPPLENAMTGSLLTGQAPIIDKFGPEPTRSHYPNARPSAWPSDSMVRFLSFLC